MDQNKSKAGVFPCCVAKLMSSGVDDRRLLIYVIVYAVNCWKIS